MLFIDFVAHNITQSILVKLEKKYLNAQNNMPATKAVQF